MPQYTFITLRYENYCEAYSILVQFFPLFGRVSAKEYTRRRKKGIERSIGCDSIILLQVIMNNIGQIDSKYIS